MNVCAGEKRALPHICIRSVWLCLNHKLWLKRKRCCMNLGAIHKRAIVFTSSINMVCYLGRLILKRC
ncbi:Uncharacterised protein [Vibrio cholerae]|nr:Uncharacterised protein [Vibrio cholerae]